MQTPFSNTSTGNTGRTCSKTTPPQQPQSQTSYSTSVEKKEETEAHTAGFASSSGAAVAATTSATRMFWSVRTQWYSPPSSMKSSIAGSAGRVETVAAMPRARPEGGDAPALSHTILALPCVMWSSPQLPAVSPAPA
eukprot:1328753-Rhodomonas_salina.3